MKKRKKERLHKEHSRIVIIGSGLAGLSVAKSLEQAGFTNIHIYERDISFESQKEGYGLTLTYNPKGPLAKLGLLEKCAQLDCPSRSHYTFDEQGNVRGYFGNAFTPTGNYGQRGNLRVPRKVLRKLLLDSLATTEIHWGYRYVSHFPINDGNSNRQTVSDNRYFQVQLQSTLNDDDLIEISADLIIAADGIRSSIVQSFYANDISASSASASPPALNMALRPVHVRLVLGISNFDHPLLKERGFYTLDGKEHRLFTMPYENEPRKTPRIMWQLSFRTSEEQSQAPLKPDELHRDVLKRVKGWHNPVVDLIRATDPLAVWGTDLMDRDPNQLLPLIPPRILVVGDAIHCMTPFKGQGANQGKHTYSLYVLMNFIYTK